MRRRAFLLAGLWCAAWLVPAGRAQSAKPKPIRVEFKQFQLKNGLRVILAEDHAAPTYSICVTYNVGSRDERPGRTGFAHLFEHMMFQGSENVGKGEHFILIENNGGNMNGTTNADRTNYFQTLPANQLDLGLFLEADRMRSLVINQANLDNQRHAVQEERRLRVDNQPYGRTFEAILETAYDNFAYKHSTIGSMEDLNAATLEDVAEFFKTYYAPNNAVLTLVGDFKTEEALAKVRKYFEGIPSQPPPKEPDMAEPEQKAERRKQLEDAFARTPRLDIVYKIPPGNTPDWYALDVLGDVLLGGQSSRLYQKLVKEQQVAVGVFGGAQERRGPSLWSVTVMARPGKDLGEIEKLVYEEIERVKKEPVADWELEKVRMQLRRQRAQALRSTLFRSILLGQYAVYYNDPGLINTIEEKVAKITKSDLQRVAARYLRETNRTVVTTVPAARPASDGR
ncbi:MAG: pitrilysin family protein [Bryobacterales bacterium]|nr:insulinase family protein [Bryobacteraceae bacterium]MDW8354106.1 pitrilysin family protein [Bryobacterales bacterium]